MPTEWETNVHIQLNPMTQSESQSFHHYSTTIWNKKSLLHGTDSYLDDTKLCNCIEVGIDLTLARHTHAHDNKLHLIIGFQPWIDAIKELDIDLQAECAKHCAELKGMTKSLCLKSHDDCTLSKPSHKYNNSMNSSSTKSATPLNAPPCQNSKDHPPKLTSNEGSLLINNHGCTKC